MKQCLLLMLFIPLFVFSQNKLEKAKEELNQQTTETTTKQGTRNVRSSTSKSTNNHSVFDDSGFKFFLLRLAFWSTIGITVGEAQERDLNPYPYYYDDEGEYAKVLSETGRKSSVTFGANYIFNNVNGVELSALYKPIPILGVKASHLHFSEENRTNVNFLDITTLAVNYYRVRQKNISLWWGLGASYVGNGIDKLGFSYNLGAEIYPVKPISLHISWQESFINSSTVGIFKSKLKYHLKNKAFYIGYHVYQLASQDIKTPAIGFEISF